MKFTDKFSGLMFLLLLLCAVNPDLRADSPELPGMEAEQKKSSANEESLKEAAENFLKTPRMIPGKTPISRKELSFYEYINSEEEQNIPDLAEEFIPVHDRWNMFYRGKWYDPYNQNRLKGDLPSFGKPGKEWFLELELVSLSLVEQRSLPTPVGISSTRRPDTTDVFGDFDQTFAEQSLIVQMSLIKGNTVFKPQDIELRIAPIINFNHLKVEETGFTRANPSRGTTRNDQHIGFRELFLDVHLGDLNDRYDFYSTRVGIQRFNADFRGFVFFDEAPAARLFGTLDNNKVQWNLAWFSRLDKDSNSLQNKVFDSRDEDVFLFNLYRQDLFFLGHTVQGVAMYRQDRAGRNQPHFDDNNFIVRPASIGDERPKNIYNTYLGINTDGHIGPLNLTTSYYYTFGSESHNAIAGRSTKIDAHMAAAELSYDFNWLRLRSSIFWASGDDDPFDGKAKGFDSIIDNPQFVGGDTSYWQRQGIPFVAGGNVALANRFSLLPDLKFSKEQGQSNFVNPGLFLYNFGIDIAATPKLQFTSNVTSLFFDRTEVLETLRQDGSIDSRIGVDASVGLLYRPFLNNNVQIRAAVGSLIPGKGLRNLYGSEVLYHGFTNLILLY